MTQANFLRSITIESPCSANWEEMVGNDRIRACGHCRLSVQDLSQMTAAEAYKLVRTSKGRLCLRIHRTPAGDVITRPAYEKLHAISRRTSRIAAGAFTAVMSLSSAAYAQTAGAEKVEQQQPFAQRPAAPASTGPSGWLSGTVTDTNGAVIPGATVQLTNEQTGETQTCIATDDGRYRIWLKTGFSYQTYVTSPNFASATTLRIVPDPSGETRIDSELNPTNDGNMGVVAVRSYEQPLVIAASDDDLETATQLLRNGENVNLAEEDGATALDVAVSNGNYKLVQLLLHAGANANAASEGGNTALFWLDDDAEPELISLLVSSGASVNHTNEYGNTPLLHVANWSSPKVIPALIGAGANVNAQNTDGDTALMIAAKEGNAETVKALLASGANYHLRNAAGEDALMLARAGEHEDVCELLHAAGAVDPPR